MIRRAHDRERLRLVGVQVAEAAARWNDAADAEEQVDGRQVTIAAGWTREGVLVVLARGSAGAALDALLRDQGIAEPQHRDRAP